MSDSTLQTRQGNTVDATSIDFPSVDAIRANRARLADRIDTTPIRLLHDPAREQLDGQSVGLIVCGANIDPPTYCGQLLP